MPRLDFTPIDSRDKVLAKRFHETFHEALKHADYQGIAALDWDDVPHRYRVALIRTFADLRGRGALG